jgi:hypothetical protein
MILSAVDGRDVGNFGLAGLPGVSTDLADFPEKSFDSSRFRFRTGGSLNICNSHQQLKKGQTII